MIGERPHPWDQPDPDTRPDAVAVLTTPQQVVTGLVVSPAQRHVYCTGCRDARSEGQEVTVYAYRCVDPAAWDVAQCYCPACAPADVETPTLGAVECLVTATLGQRSFPAGQTHRLCLTDVELLAVSPPTEGTDP